MSTLTLTLDLSESTPATRDRMLADLATARDDGNTVGVVASGRRYAVEVESVALGTFLPSEQRPTYHGIQFASCFGCGYATSDTTTLEVWNDLGGDCPGCQRDTRVLWVNTGGRVAITEQHPDGHVTVHELRLGTPDGTPPDAPGTITGPELDAVSAWPEADLGPCAGVGVHLCKQRHPESDCPVRGHVHAGCPLDCNT